MTASLDGLLAALATGGWTSTLTDAWGAVLVHLWQSTLVLVAAAVAARLLRRAPARYLEAIWGLALVRFLVPAPILSAMIAPWAERLAVPAPVLAEVNAVLAPGLPGTGEGAALTVLAVVATVAWGGGVALRLRGLTGRNGTTTQGGGTVRRACSNRVSASGASVHVDDPGRVSSHPGAPALPDLERRVREVAGRAGVPLAAVRVVDDARGPRVEGLRRPTVVVPVRVAAALDDDELALVLRHEDAHRRRHDPLRRLGVSLVTTMFWFHPGMGLLRRRLEACAEFACDEAALDEGARGADTMVRALARVVRLGLEPGPMGAPAAVGGKTLLHTRLRRLTDPEGRTSMLRTRMTTTLTALAALALTLAPLTRAGDAEKDDEALVYDTPPAVSHQVAPEYPEDAEPSIEGRVFLKVRITEEGTVENPRVERQDEALEAHPGFAKAAIDAVEQWTFEPARQGDTPVPCEVVIPFMFLHDKK